MAARSVVISLIANVGQYVAGMRSAGAATTTMARQAQTGSAAASRSFAQAGGNVTKLAKGFTVAGGVLALGLGAAVKASADFDAKMAVVKANVHSTPAEFEKLTAAVKSQGTQFGFSAMQSADAADDLAKAGLSATQIIGGGLTGALTLAAAGNVSAGDAAETAATAMTMFKLSAKDIPHIADLLAAGADKSTASVSSLSEGLMEGGSLAHLMGVSIEDTTAVLAEFDQSGLKGAKAGNALKTMFQNLLDPTDKQLGVMKDLNLSFFDANGKFIGLQATAGELAEKLGGLDDKSRNAALSILFGARSIQAANILYKDGAKGVADWQKQTNDAGFAAENAAKKLDSLKGDLNKLKSAAIELAINGGAAATKFLRPLAQGAADLAGKIAHLPAPVLTAGAGFLTLGAGGLLAAAGIIKVVGAVQKIRTQFLAARGAVAAYTTAQIAARGMTAATTDAILVQNGALVASRFTAGGSALVTLLSGQVVQVGRLGTAIALMGRTAIPTLGALQVAYMSAATGATSLGTASLAAGKAMLLAGGIIAASAAAAYGVSKLRDFTAETQVADIKTRDLAKSMKSLASGTAGGGIANLFRDSGSSVKLWGHQIGAGREEIVSTSDVVTRFKADLETLNLSGFKKGANWLGLYGVNSGAASKQVKQLDDALVSMIKHGDAAGARKAFAELTKGMNPEQLAQAKKSLSGFSAAIGDLPKKAKAVPSPTKAAADAIEGMGKKAGTSAEDVDALTKAIKGLGDAQLGARGSARGYQAAIDDATKSLKENGRTLDITTEKGRNNQEKLDAIASATTDWASTQFNLTKSMKQSNAILDTGKSKYIAQAVAFGMNRDKAKQLADQLFRMPANVDTSVNVDGVDGAIYKVDKLGNLVISVSGKKITVSASTTNAENVAKTLYSIKDAVQSTTGKSVRIPTSAIDSPETLRNLLGIKGARLAADGSVSIPTAALNAEGTTRLLGLLGRTAVDADGKTVIIPASTPGSARVIDLIKQIHGAQIQTNGRKVTITSSAPMAADTRAKIDKIRGAQVTANGKSVVINSSVPTYGRTLSQIQAILAAAQSKTISITTVFKEIHPGDNLARHGRPMINAKGGVYDGAGVQRMATGGLREAQVRNRPTLWAEAGPEAYIPLSKDARQPRNIDLTKAVADYYGYNLVKRATGGITGGMANWRSALPVQSSQRVIVQQAQAGSTQPIRIEINGVPMDNANDVAKELLYSMNRNGIGKWAGV